MWFHQNPSQAQLVNELIETNKPVVAFSLGLPYDIENYPDVPAYIASYAIERWGSPVPTAWTAAIDVIFGAQPGGKLPVSIGDLYHHGDGINLDKSATKLNDEKDTKKSKNLHITYYLLAIIIIGIILIIIQNMKRRIK